MKILVLTELGDVHAYAVAEAIRLKGGEVTLWHTADFPISSAESVLFESNKWCARVKSPGLVLDGFQFGAVWHRRPSVGLNQEELHPADREFALRECRFFRRSLFSFIAPGALWVNPPEAASRSSLKLVQHQMAYEIGLFTPDTAYTNDPEIIRAFLARHDGRAVYKPFHGVTWRDGVRSWSSYTSLLTEDLLVADHLLRAAPGIYQEVLPKAYELRVTVMGERVFGARILSQETQAGRLDWRRAYHELRIEPCLLEPELTQKCRELLNRLGLVFGCLDFVVTPEGRTVFLEVNEGGQFLFVERYAGIPLLDAFAEFLMQGRSDFSWSESTVTVRYSELYDEIRRIEEEQAMIHQPSPDRSVVEEENDSVLKEPTSS
jgi:glutathione synthase/RimK-type ligase-like ATP-grasp enzyme